MPKLFILPSVSSQEAEEIYRKFNPFLKQKELIRRSETVLKLLELAVIFSLVGGISNGDEKWIVFLVLLACIYGIVCSLLLFWEFNLEKKKREAFIKDNPHLLRFLLP